MQSLSRILLPVDFSERSVGAAHYAGSLACHFGCELVLVHVLVPPQYEFGAVDIAGSMLAELCRDRVRAGQHRSGGVSGYGTGRLATCAAWCWKAIRPAPSWTSPTTSSAT